ncbi:MULTISPECIES: serine O-acetyltransferase [Paenibacillus]|uniref:serine O-acetyltransferase n=1 Tax=Paenibacillus TaxID=44249 RepID=UPI0022B8E7D6|nr:serine O-acetyltransferase [Paenibacillus caseinilyticus]MCZ8519474.1 serine O-acetyltransferase [Paenibacillus caseinilyticus]
MFRMVRRDLQAVLHRDPAARHALEVILCYPGFHAVLMYRVAHLLHKRGFKLLARLLASFNRFLTQVEIHPAATIGEGLFIDHGCGIVIGETAEVGDGVTILQGATLGGTGKDTGKRHPTIGSHVLISAGAKVLGPFRVGDYAKIGAGSVVLKEVPPYSTVVGIPGKIVKKKLATAPSSEMDQIRMPDPVQEQIGQLLLQIRQLEAKVAELEERGQREMQHTG